MKLPCLSALRTLAIALIATAVLPACDRDKPENLIAAAEESIAKHDNKTAIIHLKNALQKAPESAHGRYLLGRALLESGDAISAEKELRKAMQTNYPPEQVIPQLARAMVDIGQSDRVVQEFGNLQLQGAGSPDLDTVLGDAFLSLGKPDQASKAYGAALVLDADFPAALLGQARLKATNNDWAGATTLVDKVLARSPSSLDALLLQAQLLSASGDTSRAIKVYDEIINAHPDSVRAIHGRLALSIMAQDANGATTQLEKLKTVAPKSAQTDYMSAAVALLRKDYAGARESIQQVLRVAPRFLPGQLLAGEIEYRLNSFSQAQTHLQKVIDVVPQHVLARRLLTAAYLKDGQPARALETITPLLARATADNSLYSLAGEVYLNNNDLALAEKYFSMAAAGDKTNPSAKTRLGQVLLAGGNVAGGIQQLEDAATIDVDRYQADVALITAHLRRKETQKALTAVERLEKKQPNNPLTHYLRAATLLMSGDSDGSRKSLERAIELDATYFPAALTLAKIDMQNGAFDAAKRRFEKILEKDSNNPQALVALAQVRSEMNAPASEVVQLLNKAISGNPTNVECRLSLIRFYLSRGDAAKAAAVAQEAQTAIPHNPIIQEALGVSLQASGDTNRAIAIFSQLVTVTPKSPQALLRLASAQIKAKRESDAMQSLTKALVLKPDLLEAQLLMISLHTTSDRTRQAVDIAKTIQRQRPMEYAGYMAEGDIYSQQKKWAEAATAYRSGLSKLRSPYLAVKAHSALLAANRAKDAAQFSTEWLNSNPKDPIFRMYLGDRSVGAKQYEAAAEQYKAVLVISPKNAIALNNLAFVAGQLKDPQATQYAEDAHKLQPNNPSILDTLGMLLADKGETARAIELLRQATALDPNAWPIRIHLAKTLAQAGQQSAAKKELEPLLKQDEQSPARIAATELLRTL